MHLGQSPKCVDQWFGGLDNRHFACGETSTGRSLFSVNGYWDCVPSASTNPLAV